jgi:hypothetical protein
VSDWRKSSYSNDNGGGCVEAASGDGMILVRDTTNRVGVMLNVPAQAWQDFLTRVR